MSDQRPPLSTRIIDSALCVTAAAAIAYAVGYAVENRDANSIGIPRSFLAHPNVEQTILLGAGVLLVVLLCAAGIYAGATAIWERLPLRISSRLRDQFSAGFRKHQLFYRAVLILAALSALHVSAQYLPVAKSMWHDSRLPDVKVLKTKSNTSLDDRNLRLVTRRDGIILLCDITSRELVVLREDDISLLVLGRQPTGQREKIKGP